jgi:hypothetical protein
MLDVPVTIRAAVSFAEYSVPDVEPLAVHEVIVLVAPEFRCVDRISTTTAPDAGTTTEAVKAPPVEAFA